MCVYMPTDYGDPESYENYIETCAKITAIYKDNEAVYLVIAGDFNCHTGSRFYRVFSELIADCNVICTDLTRLTNTFTYCRVDGKHCSWIDHVLCSPALDNLVSSCYVAYGFISSDHQPLVTVFRDLSPTCGQTAAVTGKNMNAAADLSQADDTCLSQYRYLLDIAMRSVDIPIIFSDLKQNSENVIHKYIDRYYDAVTSCVRNACAKTIPLKCQKLV